MDNIELIALIDELRALPKENEWVEFKTGTATTNDKIGHYISALSNAACLQNQAYGYFVFGITDDSHEVVGTTFKLKNQKEGNQELELYLRQYLHPSVVFTHTRRRWAFVCRLLAAGWREHGVPCIPFFIFLFFFVVV